MKTILAALVLSLSLYGQKVNGSTTAASSSTQDLSGAAITRPVVSSATAPSTCTSGKDLYVNTSSTPTLNLCTALNTWTAVGGGSLGTLTKGWMSLPLGGYDGSANGVYRAWVIGTSSISVAFLTNVGASYKFSGGSTCTSSYSCYIQSGMLFWPPNIDLTQPVNLVLETVPDAASGTGNFIFQAQLACFAAGNDVTNFSFANASSTVTTAISATQHAQQVVTVPSLAVTGSSTCVAGQPFYILLQRNGTGTADSTTTDDLVSVQLQYTIH